MHLCSDVDCGNYSPVRGLQARLAYVTISSRRRTYWALFAVACACLVAALVLAIVLPGNARAQGLLARAGAYSVYRPLGIQVSSLGMACAAALLGTLAAAGALGTVLVMFRTTVSAEIYFFAVWAATFALESLRPFGVVLALGGASLNIQLLAAKAGLWAHYTGAMSLFVAGLYAAGLRSDRHAGMTAFVAGIALSLVTLIPMNTGIWLPNLSMQSGYAFLNGWLYAVIVALTMVNFLVATRTRSDRAFAWSALGMAACMAGARMLAARPDPVALPLGFAIMSGGAALFVLKMHRFYLWQ